MIQRILACLLHVSLFSTAGLAAPLFTEDFNAEISVKGRHRQAQSGLPVKHGYDAMPGWTRLGDKMPAHFVERSAGDWAIMVVAGKANQNIFTQKKGFAANDKGHTYTVSFDAGPAVYQALSQTTAADDQIAVELLRADATVLKKHLVKPGKWEGKTLFENHTFSYVGDGGGNNWYSPVNRKLINKHGLPVSISGCLIVEGYRERTPAALATLKPMTHMSSASLLINRAMDAKHIKAKIDPKSLRYLIGWVDANGPYLGEEEIRQMPDPTPKTRWAKPAPVVKPRLKTAPRINRFNIRQDGDSSKIYLNVTGAKTLEQ